MLVTPGGQGEVINHLSLQIISDIGVRAELLPLRGIQMIGWAELPSLANGRVQAPTAELPQLGK